MGSDGPGIVELGSPLARIFEELLSTACPMLPSYLESNLESSLDHCGVTRGARSFAALRLFRSCTAHPLNVPFQNYRELIRVLRVKCEGIDKGA